jgi:hypothetical protein
VKYYNGNKVPFPLIGEFLAFYFEISGDSLEPIFRNTDTIKRSPAGQTYASSSAR